MLRVDAPHFGVASKVMAANKLGILDLTNAEQSRMWLLAFTATARSKDWTDNDEKKNITDNFIASCGLQALEKIQFIVSPRSIEDMTFAEIEQAIKTYLRPRERLTIAERANFYVMKQDAEENIMDFVVRLRKAAQHCKFDDLKTSLDPTEEMIRLALISGLKDNHTKESLLEKMVSTDMNISQILEFIRQYEQRQQFINPIISSTRDVLHITNETDNNDINFSNYKTKNKISKERISGCNYCGNYHAAKSCPAYGKICNVCKKRNHFARMCKASKQEIHAVLQNKEKIDIYCVDHSESIYTINQKLEPIKINGCMIPMQIDTGASVSVISKNLWNILKQPKLQVCKKSLEAYDGHVMSTLGEFSAIISKENIDKESKVIVINTKKEFGLLGRDLLSHNDIELQNFVNTEHKSKHNLFLPTISGVIAKMNLIKDAKDKFVRARPVPIALQEKVKEELIKLEMMGIITPIESSTNASPVVWVIKKNGDIRMCADYKVHVNDKIASDAFPLPCIETIFCNMKGAKFFAKIDLKSAYWQIELEKKAKEISVINTSRGLYAVNRLQMGMKNAAAIFQRTMENILANIDGILIYQDDVAVFASNEQALKDKLQLVVNKLKERRVTINTEKSISYCNELSFLGFSISAQGIKPDERLVEKIKAIKPPQCHKQLEQFLGLMNYFGRLIANYAEKCRTLNKARTITPFKWTSDCELSFNKLKEEVTSYPVIQPYDPSLEVTLTADSSKEALGAVLTQNGKPVIFVSKTLSKTQSNYSNIEREALAVTWSTLRLKQFLLGRKFTIITDHKPLEFLLKADKAIPTGASARICRWAIELMPFEYAIKYVPGTKIAHADALSRLKFYDHIPDELGEHIITQLHAIEVIPSIIAQEVLYKETLSDKILSQILERIKNQNWAHCSQSEKPYKMINKKLTIINGIIYNGDLVVLPKNLMEEAFRITHDHNHSGIQSSVRRLKLAVWWPGMAKDIDRMVRNCPTCQEIRPITDKSVHHWPTSSPFDRLHMDWAYIKNVGNVLVIVDAGTGWIEAYRSAKRDSQFVIQCLRDIFTRFGIPSTVVSDNAQEFTSCDLNQWLRNQGIHKMESPIYFPRSNGTAERAVQTVKNAMKAWRVNIAHCDFDDYLKKILFHHRISSLSRGKSPAELVFGRKLKIPITTTFQQGEKLWFKANNHMPALKCTYIMSKGINTSWINDDNNNMILASNNQLSRRSETTLQNKVNDHDYNKLKTSYSIDPEFSSKIDEKMITRDKAIEAQKINLEEHGQKSYYENTDECNTNESMIGESELKEISSETSNKEEQDNLHKQQSSILNDDQSQWNSVRHSNRKKTPNIRYGIDT